MIPEFKSFGKIERIGRLYMTLTQKMHGTNAQIYVYEDENKQSQVIAGCRTRWISVEDDNFGFAKFIEDNKQAIIEKLGPGRHFGEWAGPGINSGEGLKEKTLYLFNIRRFSNHNELPERIKIIPVLYSGKFSMDEIQFQMDRLKQGGSLAVPGYMKPEGIVVEVDGKFYKSVFDPEETGWVSKEKKLKSVLEKIDISYLLQPLRLEKLLSKDERLIREYPGTLPEICSLYVKDLEDEGQIAGEEDSVKSTKKQLGREVFGFVKTIMRGK